MADPLDRILRTCRREPDALTPYDAGYNAAVNGANIINCHFSLFATPEMTKEWERGNRDGNQARKAKEVRNG